MKENILITGGLGYIGSHICIELIKNNYKPIIVDNLTNSNKSQINLLKKITNKNIKFYNINLSKFNFKNQSIKSVIHCGGYKSVNESENNPIKYYENNIIEAIYLLKNCIKGKIKNFIFSSSACVYGNPIYNPIDEKHIINPNNTYGHTKKIIEDILIDLSKKKLINSVILRYFNPIGSHNSGLIGDNPTNNITNIMPVLNQCLKKNLKLKIYGKNYKTKDGTAERDYIHVCDLAKSHLKALKYCKNNNGFSIFNIGTGQKYSVLEILNTFQKYTNNKINYEFSEKRDGDAETTYANPLKAKKELNFQTKKNLEDMCKDSMRYYNGL